MLIKTRGIVFRTRKYSETSLLADIYTEEKGLRTYIISGVRSPKSNVSAGLLQVMSLVEMVAYHREDRDISRLKEIKVAYVFHALPFDIRRQAVGMFMIELARNIVHGHEVYPELFEYLFDSFVFLDETEQPVANFHLHFSLHLTGFAGFLPGGNYSDQTPYFDLLEGIFTTNIPQHPHWLRAEQAEVWSRLLDSPKENCHQILLNRHERKTMLTHLLDFYKLHIESFPTLHSHEILETVLSGV